MTVGFVRLDQLETQALALFVFAAKLITWTALLSLIAIIEFGLVRKVFKIELGEHDRGAGTAHQPQRAEEQRAGSRTLLIRMGTYFAIGLATVGLLAVATFSVLHR